ncbi:septal ring lytic transglycosylase RlpA family protein [Ostreibacterium oceani]|uniref:Endolytic peptidoglycan transglycosylase RlpA n=1 Tax=Ostreibacterium oceani TaxID=2654998 RepID=A0A6N7F0V3_9GAMM|nr:septal ring lytic transglycosylase RlpA family protein [Ostreibacterium oceani]MPV86418.1 septal ring lytic transglycosylase RlpA family protein [Ostreibacterium oceani]
MKVFIILINLFIGGFLAGCVSNESHTNDNISKNNINQLDNNDSSHVNSSPNQPDIDFTLGEQSAIGDKDARATIDTAIDTIVDDTADNPIDLRRKGRYTIKGKQYEIFASEKNFQEIGMASWYGPGFHGKKTASGEIYNMYDMTAAHKTLPLGTLVEVTDVKRKKKITVRINDRGPFHGGRIIDLSKKAAQELSMLEAGQAKVHIRVID